MSEPKNPAGAPVPTPVAPVVSTSSTRTYVFKTPRPYGEMLAEPWVCVRGDYDYSWHETWDIAMGVALGSAA